MIPITNYHTNRPVSDHLYLGRRLENDSTVKM